MCDFGIGILAVGSFAIWLSHFHLLSDAVPLRSELGERFDMPGRLAGDGAKRQRAEEIDQKNLWDQIVISLFEMHQGPFGAPVVD